MDDKRHRADPEEPGESPGRKRFRAADLSLLDILDDLDGADGRGPSDPSAGDLATVMKSFADEIAALSPREVSDCAPADSGLGFLLEASDDDLGLPPTAAPAPTDGGEGGRKAVEALGQMWAFEDDGAFGFVGVDGVAGVEDEGFALDGDLFGLGDLAPPGAPEFSWRPESLPAV